MHETIIIGGGVAGLACALTLHRNGHPFQLFEATDCTGGRVRTDEVDGFKLDRGFQVLLTAYPACRELLDYDAIGLRQFEPGAMVRQNGRFRKLSDPWRRPSAALETLLNPVGTLSDKLRIARLRRRSSSGSLEDLYSRPEVTTNDRLKHDGFSDRFIDQFFRPFLGGVFLDESLQTSSRMLEFVFRMFAAGDIAIPNNGMGSIPAQLQSQLPPSSIRTRSTVARLHRTTEDHYEVTLSHGEAFHATTVVVALPSDSAARLLDRPTMTTPWNGTTNLYFAAASSPAPHRMLMLRGDEPGPIQSAVVLSDVAPNYAPHGQSLISVSVDATDEPADGLDDIGIETKVRQQLTGWFGDVVARWQHLRTYRLPNSLPNHHLSHIVRSPWVDLDHWGKGCLIAGDHHQTASLQGAMDSGIRAAKTILS